ncbi:MAG: Amylopullulanase [Xanthomonadales bacterium]|nr:Amylopullulanase [Xanthomonadales bacterium]
MARLPLLLPLLLGACSAPSPQPVAAPASAATDCAAPPLGETTLYLRSTLNAWVAADEYALQFRCDGYYVNVDAHGTHEFKLADAGWNPATTFGAVAGSDGWLKTGVNFRPARGSDAGGTGNLRFAFAGEHTVRLAMVDGAPQLTVGPKSFDDPRAPPVTDPIALGLRYDSRSPAHKTPFGAVVPGMPVEFALLAPAGVESATLVIERQGLEGNQEVLEYREPLRIPMQRAPVGGGERWQAHHAFDAVGVHGYWFEVVVGGVRYVYQNNQDPVFWTHERGSGGVGSVDLLPEDGSRIRRYRQSVYHPDFKVPDYASDLILYYIFPDRFRNGDPTNDPRPGQRKFHDGTVELHANWNEKPFLDGSGDGSDEHRANDFFGGDLAGIIEKLPYIRDLGANAIYLTPVFAAASNHKYDTANYLEIDPGFGSKADFRKLAGQAAIDDIRLIVDTSLNHTGIDSVYFDLYAQHPGVGALEQGRPQPDSPWLSWYLLNRDNAAQPWRGWAGSRDLPELDKSSAGFIHFAYATPHSLMQHWLDQGAAGWRMGAVPWVPDTFWREWRYSLKSHRHDALTIAEIRFDASRYLLGDMFDSTMNYIFRNTVLEYAAGGDARRLYPNIELMREHYPPPAFGALMNLLSTHDQARSLHVLGDRGPGTAPAAIAQAKRRLLLAVFWQMTFPGMPAIYYGDEVGVTGGDDPWNRATYPWADRGGKPDLALLAQFQRLTALRHAHAVLRRGSLEAPLYLDEHVIVWLRRLGDEVALVAVNNAGVVRSVDLVLPADLAGRAFADALGDSEAKFVDGRLRLQLPALDGRVLLAHP